MLVRPTKNQEFVGHLGPSQPRGGALVSSGGPATHPLQFLSFGGERQRQFALSAQGSIGQGFLTEFSAAARVSYTQFYERPKVEPPQSENGTLPRSRPRRVWLPELFEDVPAERDVLTSAGALFVASGIPTSWLKYPEPLATMNSAARSLLSKLIVFPLRRYVEVPAFATPEEKHLASRDGPLWFGGYAADPDEVQVCEDVARVLDRLQATRVIVGNNGSARKFMSRCSGKIIMLNSAFSSERLGRELTRGQTSRRRCRATSPASRSRTTSRGST
jgi:hypothetical protein